MIASRCLLDYWTGCGRLSNNYRAINHLYRLRTCDHDQLHGACCHVPSQSKTATSIGADAVLVDGTKLGGSRWTSRVNTEKKKKGHRREEMRARHRRDETFDTYSFLALDLWKHSLIDILMALLLELYFYATETEFASWWRLQYKFSAIERNSFWQCIIFLM